MTPADMPAALADALDQVRRRGYHLLAGHVHEDATGIAVPVRDGLWAVVAAVGDRAQRWPRPSAGPGPDKARRPPSAAL